MITWFKLKTVIVIDMNAKQELIKKLYDEKKISFDEMMILLGSEKQIEYVPIYPQPIQTAYPSPSWEEPYNRENVMKLEFVSPFNHQ